MLADSFNISSERYTVLQAFCNGFQMKRSYREYADEAFDLCLTPDEYTALLFLWGVRFASIVADRAREQTRCLSRPSTIVLPDGY